MGSDRWTCSKGHEVDIDNAFCGTCGESRVTVEPSLAVAPPSSPPSSSPSAVPPLATPAQQSSSNRRKLILGGAAFGIILLVVLLVVVITSGGDEEPDGQTLTVTIGDTRGDCGEYTQSYVVGTRITLEDDTGDIVDSATASGAGEASNGGCYWDIELDDVPESDAYRLVVESPEGKFDSEPPPPQTLTYSYDELVDQDWHVSLGRSF